MGSKSQPRWLIENGNLPSKGMKRHLTHPPPNVSSDANYCRPRTLPPVATFRVAIFRPERGGGDRISTAVVDVYRKELMVGSVYERWA